MEYRQKAIDMVSGLRVASDTSKQKLIDAYSIFYRDLDVLRNEYRTSTCSDIELYERRRKDLWRRLIDIEFHTIDGVVVHKDEHVEDTKLYI